MTTKTDGGPAFPSKFEIKGPAYDPIKDKNVEPGTTEVYIQLGMTLRDYFAAKVLQGFMVRADGVNDLDDEYLIETSMTCYRMADAMLKAREDE